ncbi:MAG: C1 family peptidase [Acholeplasmataceae bacterium]|nr:C1 family peptidase [Acholeplasmataceae bacterium]
MKPVTSKNIEQFNSNFDKKPVQKALSRVLVKSNLADIFDVQEQSLANQFKFSHEIKTLPVSNQKQSGRCWIFAGLNVLREIVAKKYDLKKFELSQNYTAFWDKFEKINYFIESMDDFLTCHYDDRTLQHILKMGIQDGGQWDMFVSLVEKYGVVPQEAMVETTSSSGTRFMNQLINVKLRKYAADARALVQNNKESDIKALKEKTLDELYTLLVTNFGMPPKTFDFEYVSNDKYASIKGLTPQSFYKEQMGDNLKDYVSIINAPTIDKPFMKTYTVGYLGNVIDGREIKYINLEMKDLKALVVKQLKDNEVVWFGSDVARFGDRTKGVWDDQQFDYESMLGMSFNMSKEDQLYYAQGAMNHAMLLTAVHLEDEVSKRWKIENSWGDKSGQKGYYLASDSWFDQFVYQAVIHKKYLSNEQLKAWEQEPIVLKPWDPMGALANN